MASDHGEMLFDRDATAKSKPWNSASSVPLLCTGAAYGIKQDASITAPVSTVDLGATFLDFAGTYIEASKLYIEASKLYRPSLQLLFV